MFTKVIEHLRVTLFLTIIVSITLHTRKRTNNNTVLFCLADSNQSFLSAATGNILCKSDVPDCSGVRKVLGTFLPLQTIARLLLGARRSSVSTSKLRACRSFIQFIKRNEIYVTPYCLRWKNNQYYHCDAKQVRLEVGSSSTSVMSFFVMNTSYCYFRIHDIITSKLTDPATARYGRFSAYKQYGFSI